MNKRSSSPRVACDLKHKEFERPGPSLAAFLPHRLHAPWHLGARPLLCVEPAAVAEQPAEACVSDLDRDPEPSSPSSYHSRTSAIPEKSSGKRNATLRS